MMKDNHSLVPLLFPAWPSALITTGRFVLAICTEAVHVYDLSTSELVQSLHLLGGQELSNAAQLQAFKDSAGSQLQAFKDSAGSQILVTNSRKVGQASERA